MGDLTEIIITSDANGALWSCSAWDPQVGTNLCTYKGGGATTSHGISFINHEFIITADNSKPLLHIWPVNSQEQITGSRFVVPGKVTSLTVSPDGVYCVAAIGQTIYIWRISTGSMLSMIARHYQTITSLTFTDDGSHFISAGQDGLMLVWKLSSVLTNSTYDNKDPVPLYSFSDHTLPITDIAIGTGGMRALIASVSLDRGCRLYDLSSGTMLLNLVFPDALTAIAMDRLDTKIYVGTYNGSIFEFNLQAPPRAREYHMNSDILTDNRKFLGHKGPVTTLSLSLNGETLLSGGSDEAVHMWHIPSKQLIRSIPHKGAITNAKFILAPKAMFDHDIKLNLIAQHFKRMIDTETMEQAVEVLVTHPVDASIENEINEYSNVFISADTTSDLTQGKDISSKRFDGSMGDDLNEIEKLRSEVSRLMKVNKELFEHSLKSLLEN